MGDKLESILPNKYSIKAQTHVQAALHWHIHFVNSLINNSCVSLFKRNDNELARNREIEEEARRIERKKTLVDRI